MNKVTLWEHDDKGSLIETPLTEEEQIDALDMLGMKVSANGQLYTFSKEGNR